MTVKGGFFGKIRAVMRTVKLKELEAIGDRRVVGIDISILLHRFGKAVDPITNLAEGKWDATVAALMARLHRLVGHGVELHVVFDGQTSPHKRAEDERRAEIRAAKRQEFDTLLAQRNAGEPIDEARLATLAKAAWRRSPALDAALQDALDKAKLSWEVAPFEADHQLACLALSGAVQYVYSEDADLVVLGCPLVLCQLDVEKGEALLVKHAKVINSPTPNKADVLSVLAGRGAGGLRLLALFAGCDFCDLDKISLGKGRMVLQHMPAGSCSISDALAAASSLGIALPEDAEAQLTAGMLGYTAGQARDRSGELVVAINVPQRSPTCTTLLKLPKAVLPPPAAAAAHAGPRPTFRASGTVKLRAEDIEGAVLPPLATWTDFVPKKDALTIFAKTRGFTGLVELGKPELRELCRMHLQLEEERGGTIGLRPLSVIDGVKLAVANGQLTVDECAALDPAFAPPPADKWLSLRAHAEELVDALPHFEQGTIEAQFRCKGAGKKREGKAKRTRIEQGGYRRLNAKLLASLRYCPPELRRKRDVCWIECHVPASMAKEAAAKRKGDGDGEEAEAPAKRQAKLYQVMLVLEVAVGTADSYVTSVVRSKCGCKDGWLCVHKSAAMQAVRVVKERLEQLREAGETVCTSTLCKWNKPRAVASEELKRRPLAEYNMFKADIDRPDKPQTLPCHGRPLPERSAMPPEHKTAYAAPDRAAKRLKVWAALEKGNLAKENRRRPKDGKITVSLEYKSAWERTWGTPEAQAQVARGEMVAVRAVRPALSSVE